MADLTGFPGIPACRRGPWGLQGAPMKMFRLLAAATLLAATSCERHSWEETKVLHEQHGDHGHGEAHGDEHAAEEAAH